MPKVADRKWKSNQINWIPLEKKEFIGIKNQWYEEKSQICQ